MKFYQKVMNDTERIKETSHPRKLNMRDIIHEIGL